MFFSSTKLEKRQKSFCLEVRGVSGGRGRGGSNNVCTYE
jgi:hypothetical protein